MRAQFRSRISSFLPISTASITRLASLAAVAVAMGSLTACNSVTGAGEFRLVEEDEEITDPTGGSSSSSGGTSSGSGSSSSSSGGAPACKYPEGIYGPDVNDLVSPNLSWQGYAEGTTTAEEVSEIKLADLYDCDGAKGINAILVLTSATWCGICDGEAQDLNERMNGGWLEKGIHVLTLMIEDGSSKPATTATAFQWKSMPSHDLVTTAVAADPGFSFAPSGGGTIGLPLILTVDPRTMEIVDVQQGASGSYPALESLAAKNASPQ